MSVLLTAAKRNCKQEKKHKPIKPPGHRAAPSAAGSGSQAQQPVQSGPPLSSPAVAVWYWMLDSAATTVTFNKLKKEIWCNGFVVQAFEAFDETTDGSADDDGDNLEFTIFCSQTQRSHQGRLRSVPRSMMNPNLSSSMQNNQQIGSHWLTVDGCYIPEYTDQQIHHHTEEDYAYDDFADYDQSQPPAYDAMYDGKRLI